MSEARTFKEKMIEKAHRFIHEKVPAHSRAEYDALLTVNTDLALDLIAKWQQLEDLRAAYCKLQEEATRGIPLPPVKARGDCSYDIQHFESHFALQWEMDPWRARFTMREDPRARFDRTPEVARAFHQVFHKDFVPRLWAHTAETLGMASGRAKTAIERGGI